MTKMVRIENADSGTQFKVKVIAQEKVFIKDDDTGEWLFTGEWKTVEEKELAHPTAMISPYITSSRRLIIEESI